MIDHVPVNPPPGLVAPKVAVDEHNDNWFEPGMPAGGIGSTVTVNVFTHDHGDEHVSFFSVFDGMDPFKFDQRFGVGMIEDVHGIDIIRV